MSSSAKAWVSCPLEKVTSLIKDGSHGTHRDTADGVPLLSAKDVRDGILEIPEDCRRISDADYAAIHKNYSISKNDILLTVVGTIGRSCQITGLEPRFTIQRSVGVIRPNLIDPVYLYQYFHTAKFQRSLKDFTNASAQGGVYLGSLAKCCVTYPAFEPEQTKIGEILSTVDAVIKQTEALCAKQQRIKTGLMQDLLTRGIDEHGNLRSESTHAFRDSAVGRIPMEWKVKRIGEACEVCNGLRKPIASLVRENMKGEYPYYGPTGILDFIDEYRVDGKFVLIGEDGDHFLKFKKQEMTILVEGKYNVNNHAHLLRGKGDVLTEWVHLYFLHRDITLHLTRQGAGRFKLNKAALLDLELAVPEDPKEQERILRVINTLRSNQLEDSRNLKKLKALKVGLMQDLLTGKRRVTALLEQQSKRERLYA